MSLSDVLKTSFEFSTKLGIRELPQIDDEHESNVPGLYVVGDLADAPIIKVALNQGYDVARRVIGDIGAGKAPEGELDVVVIGAGPSGIGAALALKEAGARYLVLERERPMFSIQKFPKNKWIFSEPHQMESRGNFWFEDAAKEDLVDRWDEAIAQNELVIQQPEQVVAVERSGPGFVVRSTVGDSGRMAGRRPEGVASTDGAGAENTYRCRRVILATGRRGAVRRLDVPGAESDKVAYALRDPADHTGRKVLIVGGGDSAVEAAVACAEAGAQVTVSYRGDQFARAKLKNQQRIQKHIDNGTVRAEFGTTPVSIGETAVTLKKGDGTVEVENDDVLVFIGTELPAAFLKKLGIKLEGEMDTKRAVWLFAFAALVYFFYVLKQKQPFFPFGPGDILGGVPDALKVSLGFRATDGGFWGTVLYSALIVGFGIKAYRRYPMRQQKNRYISLMVYQAVFLFGIPELVAPLIIDRPWKVYALTVPWPLSIWSLIDAPSWAGGDKTTALLWMGAGAFSAFVAIPLYVRKNGERFCSYMCGCGGLAETLGDQWRHLAPRGLTSYKAEWAGRVILFAAVPVTGLIVADAWGLLAKGALYDTKVFAQHWYGLMVDFWLASVVGVAFYPYLGNRVWCRFFCPLRAWMELLSRRFSTIAITANDKCIGCGECTRYCQMGIDVQSFAQRQAAFHNGNTSCIQCGICVQVCPMEVLAVGERDGEGLSFNPAPSIGKAWH